MTYGKPTWVERLRDATQPVRELWHSFVSYVNRARSGQLDARGKRQMLVLLIGLLIAVAVCLLIAVPIAKLVSDPENFRQMLNENYLLTAVVYALINTLHVFIAIIPGEPLELGAGFLFGTWGGLAVVSIGLGLGELLAFLLVRTHGARIVHLFVSQKKLDELTIFRDEGRRNVITFLMMFIPGTPKDIMAYITALTPMRLSTWMLIALIAHVPSILISTYTGAMVAQGQYVSSAVAFVVIIVVSILGIYYYALISKQAKIAAAMDEVAHREWVAAGRPRNDAATAK